MKAKKVTALLMAAIMTLSLAACGNSSKTASEPVADSTVQANAETDGETAGGDTQAGEEGDSYDELLEEIIPEETVTLDVFDQLANYSGEQIGWFGQVMLEKFNVKLNIPKTLKDFGINEEEFKEKIAKIAELAVGDACTGSNPREIDPATMEKLFTCTYYGTEVDF